MSAPLQAVTPAWRALGAPGAAGLLALAAAAGVAWWPRAVPPEPVLPVPRPAVERPSPKPSAQRVADLLELALRAGLGVTRIEQRPAARGDDGPAATLLAMPARGRYEDVRRFVEQALREVPGLTLESLSLRRADTAQAELDADLQWRLEERPR